MVNSEKIMRALDAIVDAHFMQKEGRIIRAHNELLIENEIEKFFEVLNIPHSVQMIEAFESIGMTVYVLCASFIFDGEIETYNLVIEEC